MGFIEKEHKAYAIVLSDGSVRVRSNEGDPKAEKRSYETSDGKKGEKWERVYKGVKGIIEKIDFYDGDYGKNIVITFEKEPDHDDAMVLQLSTSQNFGEDFMKKLPNIKFDQKVSLSPYSFEDDKGKLRKGVTVWQNGEKLSNFFYDADKKENINGYPTPDNANKSFDKDDWKMYFMQARKFLINFIEENICPMFDTTDSNEEAPSKEEVPTENEAPKVDGQGSPDTENKEDDLNIPDKGDLF